MTIDLREYIDVRGHNHYREWVSTLDTAARARVIRSVIRMADGNLSGAKSEGEGVSALRIDSGPGYRIYFGQDGETLVILLAGGTKRRQQSDIQRARSLWAEYKSRQRANKREV